MQKKNFLRVALVTAGLLLIPLVAMQFSAEVVWTLSDFVLAGVLLFAVGLALEYAMSKTAGNSRWIAVLAILAVFGAVWVHLAVGIVDTWPLAGS